MSIGNFSTNKNDNTRRSTINDQPFFLSLFYFFILHIPQNEIFLKICELFIPLYNFGMVDYGGISLTL